jgi:hypothetical protein
MERAVCAAGVQSSCWLPRLAHVQARRVALDLCSSRNPGPFILHCHMAPSASLAPAELSLIVQELQLAQQLVLGRGGSGWRVVGVHGCRRNRGRLQQRSNEQAVVKVGRWLQARANLWPAPCALWDWVWAALLTAHHSDFCRRQHSRRCCRRASGRGHRRDGGCGSGGRDLLRGRPPVVRGGGRPGVP